MLQIEKLKKVVDARPGEEIFGMTMIVSKGKTILVADTNVTELPSAERLVNISKSCVRIARLFGFEPTLDPDVANVDSIDLHHFVKREDKIDHIAEKAINTTFIDPAQHNDNDKRVTILQRKLKRMFKKFFFLFFCFAVGTCSFRYDPFIFMSLGYV